MRKPRSFGEVYNDLDEDVVNVFRILRNPEKAQRLKEMLSLTPYSRKDFRSSYDPPVDDLDRAYKLIIRSFLGFGSASANRVHMTGFRSNASRNGTIPAVDWANWPGEVVNFVERLRGVVIECRDAKAVMTQHDGCETLHYVDPPYPFSTRSSLKNRNGNCLGHYYRHEMTDDQHRDLAEFLKSLNGLVIVSGYGCELYDRELYPDWERHEKSHMADGAKPRLEVIWMNAACSSALAGESKQVLMGI
jgi:DNA adenine methylase